MKIKYIILLVSIILVGFISFRTISFFTEGRSFYFKHTNSTDLSNESFGKVRLHNNIHNPSFVKHYGTPLSRDDNDLYDYYHWEGGLETASIINGKDKGDIVRLIIGEFEEGVKTKTSLKTAKEIVIGSTKQDVIASYGSSYYKRTEQGVDIVGYVDHKLSATIEFWLAGDGKVSEIRLDDTNIE
ncbi:hypothetical protein [Peribacillus frigoritolerans]|uniref:hypothetical protein n=1 Tax=Peribacillus frigoritolerans TaxID=450367 RepID=UPI002E1D0000|nr:hypothetical protein [Peribacillus frigoritolerans]MED3849673.1 hypothetical protein [Peribacillus frigoritolerans]